MISYHIILARKVLLNSLFEQFMLFKLQKAIYPNGIVICFELHVEACSVTRFENTASGNESYGMRGDEIKRHYFQSASFPKVIYLLAVFVPYLY